MNAHLTLKNVVKRFGTQVVHGGLNLDVPQGKTTIVVGHSGAGKSVMLKYFIGLMHPDEGEVLVGGENVETIGCKQLNEIRSNVGFLFQGAALFDSMTTFENVALPLREKTRLSSSEIRKRVLEKLDLVGMVEAVDKYPAELSGGMQKRVGLARSLARDPEVVLFDEPTTGLDPEATFNIYELFQATQKCLGYTSLIVSHDLPKVFRIADQIAVLNRGHITVCERPSIGQETGEEWLDRVLEIEKKGLEGVLL